MNTILDDIIASKRKEIEMLKPKSSVQRFERDGFFWKFSNRSLAGRLLIPGSNGIIAEFKRKSPSKGWFKTKELEVETVIKHFNNKATGLSILTDEPFFGGDLDDLIQAKVISDIPVLRKDFIIDQWQIAESKAFGADIILLIAACLTKQEVKEFAEYAKSIGLETILEIHKESELESICEAVDIIGINNRDLSSFKVEINTSLDLIGKINRDKPVISESGIDSVDTILTLRDAGFKGFLIGERFMKEPEPGKAFDEFIGSLMEKSLNKEQ